MPWSKDLRRSVIANVEAGATYEEAAAVAGVGRASVNPWLRRVRETGDVDPKPRGGGRKSPIDEKVQRELVKIVAERDNATDQEICDALIARTGVTTSRSGVRRALTRLGCSRKKSIYGD